MNEKDLIVEKASSQWKHARGCKKSPEECKTCQRGIQFFSELPLQILSRVLGE